MPAPRRVLVVVSFLFALLSPTPLRGQLSDEAAAQQVLGPNWKQLSRRAGMIFAGTLFADSRPAAAATTAGPEPFSIELHFRVDTAIAGVQPGQALTIREWTGAILAHRPIPPGQRVLLFLYPPSRLGLTSPVAGPLGQIFLDSTGSAVAPDELARRNLVFSIMPVSASPSFGTLRISVAQLARAIRQARQE